MAIIPIAEWLPDQAPLGNRGSVTVQNARPAQGSYIPMPDFVPLTNGLDAYARGAIDVRDDAGNVYQYAGDAAKLYQLSTTTWTDKSVGGGYSTASDEVWEFAKFEETLVAVNGHVDNPQSIEIGGAQFAALTTAVRARHAAVVTDKHLVFGNTWDATDGAHPDRVRWSAINDPTDWTVSPVTGADYRDLKGAAIQRIVGGQFGVILTENSTFRMDWVGAPAWFQIQETLPGIGAFSPGSVCQEGTVVYVLGPQGAVAIVNGTTVQPIGANKVNEFILHDIDATYRSRISSVADSDGYVYWAYPGPGNNQGCPNRILVFHRDTGKWSLVAIEVDLLWRAGGVGFTMDGLDSISTNLDTGFSVSLDSDQWKGSGLPLLAAFDTQGRHGFFDDAMPMPATFELRETEIHAGRRTHLTGFTPLIDGGSVTARIGSRNRQVDAAAYTGSLSQQASGRISARVNARFHRIEMSVSGDWNHAIGAEVDNIDARAAERRG